MEKFRLYIMDGDVKKYIRYTEITPTHQRVSLRTQDRKATVFTENEFVLAMRSIWFIIATQYRDSKILRETV